MKRALLTGIALLCASPAFAHKPSDSSLWLQPAAGLIEGRWDIAVRDLDHAIGLDSDGDGVVTWGELRRRHEAIARYALVRLGIRTAGNDCTLRVREQLLERHNDGAYSVLRFVATCPARLDQLTVSYNLLFDLDPQHRGILRVGNSAQVRLFSADAREQRIDLRDGPTATQSFGAGLRSIFHPYLPLVLGLLLVSARRRSEPTRTMLKSIAALLLACSLTLPLAALHAWTLPERTVHAVMLIAPALAFVGAASHAIAARVWMITFAFGLALGPSLAAGVLDASYHLPTPAELLAYNAGFVSSALLLALPLMLFTHAPFPRRRLSVYGRTVFGKASPPPGGGELKRGLRPINVKR